VDPKHDARPVRTIVLVGFMAAGKTTVGRILADRLGWRFVDVDETIVREQGETIADLFTGRGEPAFREIEREVTHRWIDRHDVVLATGGGWAAQPGALDALPAHALTVCLRVTAEEAVRRATAGGTGGAQRPLLAGTDPLETARDLLRQRAAAYERAARTIDVVGMTPEDIATRIEFLLRASD
jgi:shikimate kinase